MNSREELEIPDDPELPEEDSEIDSNHPGFEWTAPPEWETETPWAV